MLYEVLTTVLGNNLVSIGDICIGESKRIIIRMVYTQAIYILGVAILLPVLFTVSQGNIRIYQSNLCDDRSITPIGIE